MGTSHLLLVFISYIIFSNINPAYSSSYGSLVVLKDSHSSTEVSLPSKAIEKDGYIMYPEVEEDGKSITFLCPDKPNTTRYSKDLPLIALQDEYCLFSCGGPPCPEEIKPLLIINEGIVSYTKCYGSEKYEFYRMGFNYCRYTEANNENNNRHITSKLLSLYDVCFDTDHSRTVWTRHFVQTPSMLQGEGLKSQQIKTEEEEFNDDPFTLSNKQAFSNVAKLYKNQPDKPYKMIPQRLVPREDMALKLWKKTTTHYLNTAPLWDKLVPLMKAINDGIRKAAIATYFKARGANLNIYTTVTPIRPSRSTFRHWLSRIRKFIFRDKKIESNIWCKVVHHWSDNQGIMIFLQNSPGKPPVDADPVTGKLNSKSIPKQCKDPVPCDFRKWSNEPESLSDEILQYAYCCKVDNKQVEKLFNLNYLYNLEFLDIEDRMKWVNSEVEP